MRNWDSAEHQAHGQKLPDARPLGWMAAWSPTRHATRSPCSCAASGRDEKLVEERNETMAEDDAAFVRGAAGVVATDLPASRKSVSDIWLDVCGDTHVGNFGTHGSPERKPGSSL